MSHGGLVYASALQKSFFPASVPQFPWPSSLQSWPWPGRNGLGGSACFCNMPFPLATMADCFFESACHSGVEPLAPCKAGCIMIAVPVAYPMVWVDSMDSLPQVSLILVFGALGQVFSFPLGMVDPAVPADVSSRVIGGFCGSGFLDSIFKGCSSLYQQFLLEVQVSHS